MKNRLTKLQIRKLKINKSKDFSIDNSIINEITFENCENVSITNCCLFPFEKVHLRYLLNLVNSDLDFNEMSGVKQDKLIKQLKIMLNKYEEKTNRN